MSDQYTDQQFVEYILKSILLHPEDIQVERRVDDLGILITVKVHDEDMGTIIGKGGQTAKSIRTLLRVLGSKNKERVNLKIVDNREAQSFTDSLDSQLENIDV